MVLCSVNNTNIITDDLNISCIRMKSFKVLNNRIIFMHGQVFTMRKNMSSSVLCKILYLTIFILTTNVTIGCVVSYLSNRPLIKAKVSLIARGLILAIVPIHSVKGVYPAAVEEACLKCSSRWQRNLGQKPIECLSMTGT